MKRLFTSIVLCLSTVVAVTCSSPHESPAVIPTTQATSMQVEGLNPSATPVAVAVADDAPPAQSDDSAPALFVPVSSVKRGESDAYSKPLETSDLAPQLKPHPYEGSVDTGTQCLSCWRQQSDPIHDKNAPHAFRRSGFSGWMSCLLCSKPENHPVHVAHRLREEAKTSTRNSAAPAQPPTFHAPARPVASYYTVPGHWEHSGFRGRNARWVPAQRFQRQYQQPVYYRSYSTCTGGRCR
jgi:hypothetical protein